MSETEYLENFGKLKQLEPNHVLIETLNMGFDKFNAIYLAFALKKLAENAPIQVIEKEKTQVEIYAEIHAEIHADVQAKTESKEIKTLRINRADLYAQRASLSNSLHEFPYTSNFNGDRANVMDNIKVIQLKIAGVFADIDCIEKNGCLPTPSEKYPVPILGGEREKKKTSLRGSISHKRAYIKTISDLEIDEKWDIEQIQVFIQDKIADETLQAQIINSYLKLFDLKIHLKYVESSIENEAIHAS